MIENNNKKTSQEKELSGLRKLAKRRWFYPALYLCAAALVLAGVLFFQTRGAEQAKQKEEQNRVVFNQNKPSKTMTAADEVFEWPAVRSDTQVVQPFYDPKGTVQEQEAALVNYNHTFVQNTGINIGAKNDQTFAVTAALSGKVVEAKKDPLLGYTITLKHANGVETLYQSLATSDVALGQKVEQGETLGTAGTENFNKAMAVHLHFEIRKDGVPVNPETYMNKGTADVTTKASNTEATTASPSASEKLQSDQGTSSSTSSDSGSTNSKGGPSKGSSVDQSKMDTTNSGN
ncbi:MAG: M23 family metallopeptidase [Sporolactobacillus sp.]